jgi:hypothetical protein
MAKQRLSLAFVSLLILGMLAGGLFVCLSVRSLRATGPVWVEGPAVGSINAIRIGRLYQADALRHPPYSIQTHAPLSYWIGAALSTPGIDFWPLRLTNMIVTLACAWLIGLLARGDKTNTGLAVGIFAALVFLACPPVLFWSQPARFADSLCTLFTLIALAVARDDRRGLKREAIIAVAAACAILSKQTAVVTLIGPLLVYDLWQRRVASCVRYLAGTAVLLGAVFLILQYRTDGGFLTNVISGNLVTYTFYQFLLVAGDWAWPLWPFAVIVCLLGGWRNRLAAIYFGISLAFGLATCGKFGSDIMYFFDVSAALAIMSGEVARSICVDEQQRRARAWICAALMAAGLLVMLVKGDMPLWQLNGPEFSRNYESLLADLGQRKVAGKSVLSEDPSVSLRLGETPWVDDMFVFGELVQRNVMDDRPLVEAVGRQEFYAIIMRDPRYWPAALRSAVTQHYAVHQWVVASPMGNYAILLPLQDSKGTPGLR